MNCKDCKFFGGVSATTTPLCQPMAHPTELGNTYQMCRCTNQLTTIASITKGTTTNAILSNELYAAFFEFYSIDGSAIVGEDDVCPNYSVAQIQTLEFDGLTTINLVVGGTINILPKLLISPINAVNKTLDFDNIDEAIAIISESGLITALAIGSTNITISTTDGSNLDIHLLINVV